MTETTFGLDGLPADWHDDITARGLSKNETFRHYVVRLTVQGKQHFIANTRSQTEGARLYDLAVWKMLPKSTRVPRFNCEPFEFESITQEHVDVECERLNALYDATPFINNGDEHVPESELRAARLAKPVELPTNHYDRAVERLRRLSVLQVDAYNKLRSTFKSVPLNKLPAVSSEAESLIQSLADFSIRTDDLAKAMESQRAFFIKSQSL